MIPRFRDDTMRQHAIGAARLPSASDTDWILSAVHHDEIGVEAWERIRSDADPARLPDAHSRLAPLVYENLSRAKVEDPLLLDLAGTRLSRLASLLVLTEAVMPILVDLVADGIDVMLLKGAALSDVYTSPAQRPMADIDLLVRPKDVPRAAKLLERHGLTAAHDVRDPVQVACVHSIAFESSTGFKGSVDLHWMASPQLAPSGIAAAQWHRPWFEHLADDEFWNRARTADFMGVNVYAPSMTDLLFLVVLHGVRFGIADDTRWAVDAATILRYRHDEIDWEFFVDQAIRRRVAAVTATALAFLRDNVFIGSLEGEIPPAVITRLQSSKPSLRERVIDRLSRHEHTMRPGAGRIVIDVIIRHLVFTANEPLVPTARSFPWFVALWLGVEKPREIPGFLRRGTWRERLPS